jgi:hypothetical protein
MSLDHDAVPVAGTHIYTTSLGWKAFMMIFGAAMAIGGLVAIWFIHTDPVITSEGAVWLDLLSLASAAFGIFCLLSFSRYRVVLTRDGIEQQQAFTLRKLRNHEIASWRIVQVNNNPPIIELIPKDGATKKMRISRTLRTDKVFEDWLAAFPNQDLLDAQQLEKEVQIDSRYGSNPTERLRRLAQLRTFTEWLGRVGLAVALWGIFYPHPYRLVMVLLGVCPLIGLAIVMWSGGLIHVDQKAKDKRPTVAYLLIMPSLAVALRAILDVSLLDWSSALAVTLFVGALFALAAVALDTEQRRWPAFLLTMGIIGVPWSWGVATELNVQLDHGPQQGFETRVIDKHISNGKHRTWYLTVAPWGPVKESGDESVDSELYDETNVGDAVCVSLNQGALGWRWYWLDRCPGK